MRIFKKEEKLLEFCSDDKVKARENGRQKLRAKPNFKYILATVTTRCCTRKQGAKTLSINIKIIANDQFVNYKQE